MNITLSQMHTQTNSHVRRGSTRSISGVEIEQHFENGRRYCNEDYYMPNDEQEQTRLAITYQAYFSVLGDQLTLGPIPRSAKRILEVGTGTGDWAIAVAERYPRAEVIALDITTSFHPASGPPNVTFELDDAQDEWTDTEPFDFIHIRGLAGAFSNWGAIYGEVSKHLRPGGCFEIADSGMVRLTNEPSHSYLSIFNSAIQSAAEKAGTPLGSDHLKKSVLENAGLSVVKSKTFDVPLGIWSPDPRKKVQGKMALISTLEGLEATSLRLLTRHMGWKEGDVRDVCEKVKEEVMAPGANAYLPLQFVVGRNIPM